MYYLHEIEYSTVLLLISSSTVLLAVKMVRKLGKFGVRTGATLKFGGNLRRARQYGKDQWVLVKTVSDPSNIPQFGEDDAEKEKRDQKTDALFEEHIPDGGIGHQVTVTRAHFWGVNTCIHDQIYSLNKRKRWLLPGMIRTAIDEVKENEDVETKENVRISLVERQTCPIGSKRSRTDYQWNYNHYNAVFKNSCTAYHDSKLKNPHRKAQKTFTFEGDIKKAEKQKEKNEEEKKKAETRVNRGSVRRSRNVQRPHLLNINPAPAENPGHARIDAWIFR